MPKMSTAPIATTVQTTEVQLAPKLRKKLLNELRLYADLQATLKEIQAALDEQKVAIEDLREEAGVTSLGLEGFKVTRVAPIRSVVNHRMMIDEGWISPSQLEQATEAKPGKPYTKVSVPGGKDEE